MCITIIGHVEDAQTEDCVRADQGLSQFGHFCI